MIKTVSPESVGLSSTRLDRIPEHLKSYVDDGRIPGYLVLIARHGLPAYLHRYGSRDVEENVPVEEDTIFRIYSMSKAITTAAALMLLEEGKYSLDDPVSKYIPEF